MDPNPTFKCYSCGIKHCFFKDAISHAVTKHPQTEQNKTVDTTSGKVVYACKKFGIILEQVRAKGEEINITENETIIVLPKNARKRA